MKPLLDPHRGQLQVERVRATQVGGRHQQDHRDQLGPAGLEVGTSLSRKRWAIGSFSGLNGLLIVTLTEPEPNYFYTTTLEFGTIDTTAKC